MLQKKKKIVTLEKKCLKLARLGACCKSSDNEGVSSIPPHRLGGNRSCRLPPAIRIGPFSSTFGYHNSLLTPHFEPLTTGILIFCVTLFEPNIGKYIDKRASNMSIIVCRSMIFQQSVPFSRFFIKGSVGFKMSYFIDILLFRRILTFLQYQISVISVCFRRVPFFLNYYILYI